MYLYIIILCVFLYSRGSRDARRTTMETLKITVVTGNGDLIERLKNVIIIMPRTLSVSPISFLCRYHGTKILRITIIGLLRYNIFEFIRRTWFFRYLIYIHIQSVV